MQKCEIIGYLAGLGQQKEVIIGYLSARSKIHVVCLHYAGLISVGLLPHTLMNYNECLKCME